MPNWSFFPRIDGKAVALHLCLPAVDAFSPKNLAALYPSSSSHDLTPIDIAPVHVNLRCDIDIKHIPKIAAYLQTIDDFVLEVTSGVRFKKFKREHEVWFYCDVSSSAVLDRIVAVVAKLSPESAPPWQRGSKRSRLAPRQDEHRITLARFKHKSENLAVSSTGKQEKKKTTVIFTF